VDAALATPGVTVELGAEVRAVVRKGAGFEIVTADDRRFEAGRIALAAPPDAGAKLMAGALPDLGRALGRIDTATIESTAVVVPQGACKLERFAGIIPLGGAFYSAVSRDVVPHDKRRGFTFHFRRGIPETERLDTMAKVLGVDRKQFEHVVSRQVTLPSPRVGHAAVVQEILAAIEGAPVFVVGNYFAGLSIEDCVQRAEDEAARTLSA
jgi:protoporphyrinogen oxidase